MRPPVQFSKIKPEALKYFAKNGPPLRLDLSLTNFSMKPLELDPQTIEISLVVEDFVKPNLDICKSSLNTIFSRRLAKSKPAIKPSTLIYPVPLPQRWTQFPPLSVKEAGIEPFSVPITVDIVLDDKAFVLYQQVRTI